MSTATLDELYELQREAEWDKAGRTARIRQLKDQVADEEEGRKAQVQLAQEELEAVIAEYTPALDSAIEAYRSFITSMEELNAASRRRQLALSTARKLDLGSDIPAEANDSFARRCTRDYDLSLFVRTRGVPVINSGWPR